MKLRVLRTFWGRDWKRGCMVARIKGETFEADESEPEQALDIYNLLRDLRATVTDSKFVSTSAQYVCFHEFGYENEEGLPRYGSVGKEIRLGQEKAVELLVRGFIRPVNDNAWTPAKLLGPVLKEDKVKRMFDDEPIPKQESWIRRGMSNGNR